MSPEKAAAGPYRLQVPGLNNRLYLPTPPSLHSINHTHTLPYRSHLTSEEEWGITMYKSRLQEYCQRNSWSLPEYTITKDGPDHNPKFKATVLVNGVDYETEGFHKSSKHAQNETAKVAFESLTDIGSSSSGRGNPFHGGSSKQASDKGDAASRLSEHVTFSSVDLAKLQIKDFPLVGRPLNDLHKNSHTKEGTQGDTPVLVETTELMASEVKLVYKSYLQEFVQRRNWNLPVYSHVREGPPHVPLFKATVIVEGKSFETTDFFGTLREAEHAAAKVALASFHEEGIQEDKSISFKHMLQEYTQKRKIGLPIYTTVRSGASHLPSFQSTVQMDGEAFSGDTAATRKEAEGNAAKIAWFALQERGSRPSSHSELQLGVIAGASTLNLVSLEQNLKPKASSSCDTEAEAEENTVLINRGSCPACCRLTVAADAGASTMNYVSSNKQNLKSKSSLTYNNGAQESTVLISGEELVIAHDSSFDKEVSHLESQEEATISPEFAASIYSYLHEQFIAGNPPAKGIGSSPSALDHSRLAPTSSFSKRVSSNSGSKGSNALNVGSSTAPKVKNKVVVFPRLRDLSLPQGVTQQQFSDRKWVAVTAADSHCGAK